MKKDLNFNQDKAPEGFNILVTHRDPRTGLVAKQDPYTLHLISENDGKVYLFERPVGSGNVWNKQGKAVGRYIDGEWRKDEAHVEFILPETSDDKLAREYAQKDLELAELKKELNAIKGDATKKHQAKTDKGA